MITTIAGNGGWGYSGDGGSATNASLNSPSAVAMDKAGNLFIADSGNNCIRAVWLQGQPILKMNDLNPADGGDYRVIVSNPSGSVTSIVAAITVTLPVAVESLMIEPLAGKQMRLSVTGQSGRGLTLQGSPDLFHWANLGRYTNTSGTLVLTSALPSGQDAYFYRTMFRDGTNPFVPPPNLNDAWLLPNGRMRFQLNASPASRWTLEGSPDLQHWGSYGQLTNFGSSLQVTNKARGTPPAYFYRVVQP
jgi:hypothetical protein